MSIQSTILKPEELVDLYRSKKADCKGGSACFYGHWFGRPYDNFHEIKSVSFEVASSELKFTFMEGETLIIQNPQGIKEIGQTLTIEDADKILWRWYYYGKPTLPENLFYIEVTRQDGQLTGQTNVDWYHNDFSDLDKSKSALKLG